MEQACAYEQKRVELRGGFHKTDFGKMQAFEKADDLIHFLLAKQGPRLVVMNTVFSAAFLANQIKCKGLDVLHLSTALAPVDREKIIEEIYTRLIKDPVTHILKYNPDWTLVATRCIESGLNFSFRNGFAELCSVQSFLQISGRIGRDGEYPDAGMWCFVINNPQLTNNPDFKISQKVFRQLIVEKLPDRLPITELVTEAMKRELKENDYRENRENIKKFERLGNYPEVARLCKVIDSKTKLAIVNPELIGMLENGKRVNPLQLIKNSVHIREDMVCKLNLPTIRGYENVYKMPDNSYDPMFLGYMSELI